MKIKFILVAIIAVISFHTISAQINTSPCHQAYNQCLDFNTVVYLMDINECGTEQCHDIAEQWLFAADIACASVWNECRWGNGAHM